MALCYSLRGTGCEMKRGIVPRSMSLNFIHRLEISFKRTLPRRWCLKLPPPYSPRKVLFLSNMEELCMSNCWKKIRVGRNGGTGGWNLFLFVKEGKRVAIFHLTTNIYVELKWTFVRMSKQKRETKEIICTLLLSLEVAQNVTQFSIFTFCWPCISVCLS